MKRRNFLWGGAGLTATAAAAAALWKPADLGAPHDGYFSRLNELLKAEGPGRPVMIVDLDRMNHNIDVLTRSVGPAKTYRVVVKSLPSVKLLEHVTKRADTNALMVFHQPFLNAVANSIPRSDVLLGKPLPVAAARTFYALLGDRGFAPSRQVQWLIDSRQRLEEYHALARELGVRMRINFEIDVGLHRGGLPALQALDPLLAIIGNNPDHLEFAGFMGYEPHLTGLAATLENPAVQGVLTIYRGFVERARQLGAATSNLTLNGAGSHTLRIYERDNTMNDLAAGSGVVMPTDFDTHHLHTNQPAVFIATPVLKRYNSLVIPGDPWFADLLQWWDPNMRRLHYVYGGYWKARYVSPTGIPEPFYHSTNQEPFTTSESVDLAVGDYVFLRPTQSERVMLGFGDLLVVSNGELIDRWPVFQETG
jgi:D-serine deaminase-like pyridoxal phosphate-dependent protein